MMKFSVTIPAYKSAYLGECIDSILCQTYKDFELIIVNDASPEDLDGIVNSYSDQRIRYYKNEKNCGAINVVDNWNKCLEYAKGDYIICMGDDDILKPWCLEEYVKLINKYPNLGIYHAWTEIINEKSGFFNVTAARCEYESVYSLIWHRWNGRIQFIGDFLFDTKQLKKNKGFYKLPLAWGSDDISAYMAAIPSGIANTQRVCFCYRQNSQTISMTSNPTIKIEAINKQMAWFKTFLERVPVESQDKHYRESILKEFNWYFQKRKGYTISTDLRCHSICRIIYWIMNRKKHNVDVKTIIYALIQAYKS